MSYPTEHIIEAQKLQADALVSLYELQLKDAGNTLVCFKDGDTVTWQSKVYDSLPCRMSGVGKSADEQVSRPTFQVSNPAGIFCTYVVGGALAGATLTRKRVLRTHLDANNGTYSQEKWLVSRVTSMNNVVLAVELRMLADGPNYILPARAFTYPEFPTVSI